MLKAVDWRERTSVRWWSFLLFGLACGEVGFDAPHRDAAADRSLPDGFVGKDSSGDRTMPAHDATLPDARLSDADIDAQQPDATVDAATDAAGSGSCDDGIQNQGELFVDSGGPCTIRAPGCADGVDPWTVGLFTFDAVSASVVEDATDAGDATIQSGPAAYDTSTSGCGMAWRGTGSAWLSAPNVATWKGATGAADFWLRVPDMTSETAMQVALSRDASGNGDGHMVVAVTPQQRVAIRFQSTASEIYRCSAMLTAGSWVHVGINWGAPDLELYIDGSEANFVGNVPFADSASTVNCTADVLSSGLDGNDEPWVFGANQWSSSPGTSDPTSHYLKASAALDHVRISSSRRDFTR